MFSELPSFINFFVKFNINFGSDTGLQYSEERIKVTANIQFTL